MRVIQEVEPKYFEQVVENPQWKNAMNEEMTTLDAKSIWDLVFLPKRQECNWVQLGANGCKWVYKVKHNGDGLVSRYKTKLITKAYAQTYDIDYEENYSSIVKMTIIRTMIVMATIK